MGSLTVLDASVLIAHFDENDAHHNAAVRLIRGLASGRIQLVASVVTHAEVLVAPAAAGQIAAAEAAIAGLGVGRVPVGDDAAPRLAALRAETGGRIPDICVLLAAEETRADQIATFDESLAAAARSRGIGVA